jgi:hypothetical protein
VAAVAARFPGLHTLALPTQFQPSALHRAIFLWPLAHRLCCFAIQAFQPGAACLRVRRTVGTNAAAAGGPICSSVLAAPPGDALWLCLAAMLGPDMQGRLCNPAEPRRLDHLGCWGSKHATPRGAGALHTCSRSVYDRSNAGCCKRTSSDRWKHAAMFQCDERRHFLDQSILLNHRLGCARAAWLMAAVL